MAGERQRIIELALESLEARKQKIEAEIAALRGQINVPAAAAVPARRRRAGKKAVQKVAAKTAPKKRRARFTKEERLRRGERMRAYWDAWRKAKKEREKK